MHAHTNTHKQMVKMVLCYAASNKLSATYIYAPNILRRNIHTSVIARNNYEIAEFHDKPLQHALSHISVKALAMYSSTHPPPPPSSALYELTGLSLLPSARFKLQYPPKQES